VVETILLSGLALWLFFTVYVLVMGIYRAHLSGRLNRFARVLLFPWVALGYVADVVLNATLASVLFLDPPRELLVTTRLKRYIRRARWTWRGRVSWWVCEHMLDVFDPKGDHC